MRSDAQENRRRLLDAAVALFAEKGTAVSVAELVAAAGVGAPTLYRHFGTKQGLIEAVAVLQSEQAGAQLARALSQPTGWDALVSVVTDSIEFARRNRAVRDGLPIAPAIERMLFAGYREIIERAHAENSVRRDFRATDIPFLIAAVGEVARLVKYEPTMQSRYLALVMDGVRPPGSTELPGRAPSPHQIRTAFVTAEPAEPAEPVGPAEAIE